MALHTHTMQQDKPLIYIVKKDFTQKKVCHYLLLLI